MDPISLSISALALALSLWVNHRANQINNQAREELAAKWKDDPEASRIVMSRLGWWERRKIAQELAKY